MLIIATVRSWYAKWQTWRNDKHRSNWDNPATGTDLLARMIETKKRKENPLP